MRFGLIFGLIIAIIMFVLNTLSKQTVKKEVVIRETPPMIIEDEIKQAHRYLNNIRMDIGLNSFRQNNNLSLAANSHAKYLVKNGVSTHIQTKGFPKFMGESPKDRAFNANYLSSYVVENLSTKNTSSKSSMDSLFAAIYHRFGFLELDMDEIGINIVQNKEKPAQSAFVYLMGNQNLNQLCSGKSFNGSGKYIYKACKDANFRIKESLFLEAKNRVKKYNPKIITYPYDKQENIVPAFFYETPDPLPFHEVSGFPISVEFNDFHFKKVDLISFRLFKGGKEIHDVLFMDKINDPHQRFSAFQFALFPLKRLDYDSTYDVELTYFTDKEKEKQTLNWSFHTQGFDKKVHVIGEKEAYLKLANHEEQIIYFSPLNEHELITYFEFPREVDGEFIDYNTIKLRFLSEDIEEFDLNIGLRSLHVKIEG